MRNRVIAAFVAIGIAGGLLSLFAVRPRAQAARPDRAVRPAPRWPDGRVNLNSPPAEKGLWGGGGRLAVNPRSYEPRTTLRAPIHIDNVPLQDWARALVDYRHEVTIDDPGAYTAPWTTGFSMQWTQGTELFEYICQENNHGPELMVGAETSVDRSSPIVP